MEETRVNWKEFLMVAKTPQSKKARGRKLQRYVVEKLIKEFGLHEDDCTSRSMGAGGEDVLLSPVARDKFPFSVECKNTEKLAIWSALEQAEENSGDYAPLVIFKRNRSEVYCAIKFDDLLKILQGLL